MAEPFVAEQSIHIDDIGYWFLSGLGLLPLRGHRLSSFPEAPAFVPSSREGSSDGIGGVISNLISNFVWSQNFHGTC